MSQKEYRPEIIPEDDDLICEEVLEQMEDISIFSWLEEDLSQEAFDSLTPTQVIFGMIENEHKNDPTVKHPRPFIFLYKTGNDCAVGFQITSSQASPLCKYPLKDWTQYDLRKQSFINIHHTVKIYRNEIKFTKAKNLTRQDLLGLIDFMRNLAQHNRETNYPAAYNIEAEIKYLQKLV